MSIEKIYEIGCEECGEAYHGYWTIKEAEANFIRLGGIKKGKNHYCGKECYEKAMKKKALKKTLKKKKNIVE